VPTDAFQVYIEFGTFLPRAAGLAGTFMGYDFVFSTWAFSAYASCFLGIAESVCWTLLVNAMIAILTIWLLDLISVVVHLLNNSMMVAASSLLIDPINVTLPALGGILIKFPFWIRSKFYYVSSFGSSTPTSGADKSDDVHCPGRGLSPKLGTATVVPPRPWCGHWCRRVVALTTRKRYRGALRRTAKTSRRRNAQRRAHAEHGIRTKADRRKLEREAHPPADHVMSESAPHRGSYLPRLRSSFSLSFAVFLKCFTDADAATLTVHSVASGVIRAHPAFVSALVTLLVLTAVLRLYRVSCATTHVGQGLLTWCMQHSASLVLATASVVSIAGG
jgi:hypothetical protein